MGTRCHIGVRKGNKVDFIYCGHDGYVDGIGELLIDRFNSIENARKLIDLGNVSWVYDCSEKKAEEYMEPYLNGWELVEVIPGVFACVEKGTKSYSIPAPTYVEFGKSQTIEDSIMIEYWYLFDDGEWMVSKGGDVANYISVKEALKNPELVESRARRGRMLKEGSTMFREPAPIYDDYYSEEQETRARESLFDKRAEEEGWESIEDVPDSDVEEELRFLADVDAKDLTDELDRFFKEYEKFVISGEIGRWNGKHSGADVIVNMADLWKYFKDCENFKFYEDENGDLCIKCSHHDGTNFFVVRPISSRGYEELEQMEVDLDYDGLDLGDKRITDWLDDPANFEHGYFHDEYGIEESSSRSGRMLKEYKDEMPIPYLIGQVKFEDGWSPMVVYLNWGDDRYWYEASVIEAGGVMDVELGHRFVVSKVKPGTDKCDPEEVYAVKRHFFDGCEDQDLPVREVKTVRELGLCAPVGRELHSQD